MPIARVGTRISTLQMSCKLVGHIFEDLRPQPMYAGLVCRKPLRGHPFVMRRNELKILRNMNMRLLSAGCGAKGSDRLRPWVSLVLFLVSIASCHCWMKSTRCTVARFGIGQAASHNRRGSLQKGSHGLKILRQLP